MTGLDGVVFDTRGLQLQSQDGNTRSWMSDTEDAVMLSFFAKPLGLRAAADELDAIRARSRTQAARYGGAIVEVELCMAGGVAAVREILKIPQTPIGMGYFGSLTIPLANSGYMLSVASHEKGITGMRDTAIFARLVQSGEVVLNEGTEQPVNWMQDPYDPAITGRPARNRSEDEAYDALFPDHPLSRVRRLLRQIESSFEISAAPAVG